MSETATEAQVNESWRQIAEAVGVDYEVFDPAFTFSDAEKMVEELVRRVDAAFMNRDEDGVVNGWLALRGAIRYLSDSKREELDGVVDTFELAEGDRSEAFASAIYMRAVRDHAHKCPKCGDCSELEGLL